LRTLIVEGKIDHTNVCLYDFENSNLKKFRITKFGSVAGDEPNNFGIFPKSLEIYSNLAERIIYGSVKIRKENKK
jgi:hypothetical protein